MKRPGRKECEICSTNTQSIYGNKCKDCFFETKCDLMMAASDLPIKRGWEKYVKGWVVAPSYSSWITKVMKWPHPFMVDNGAWSDHLNGVNKTPLELLQRTVKLSNKVIENGGEVKFMVLPDKVGCWKTTFQHLLEISNEIKDLEFPLAIAIQDGFKVKDIEKLFSILPIKWFFIGGSSFRFKKEAVKKLEKYDIPIHVGKVHRINEMCYFVNQKKVLSIDTSTYSRPQSKARIEKLNIRLQLFHSYKAGKQMKII